MRKFYLIVALFMLMILTACASVSGTGATGKGNYIISGTGPTGKDNYLISGKNLSIRALPFPIETEFIKKASEFCKSQGKDFELVKELIVHVKGLKGTADGVMTFRCVESK